MRVGMARTVRRNAERRRRNAEAREAGTELAEDRRDRPQRKFARHKTQLELLEGRGNIPTNLRHAVIAWPRTTG
jgi:hypothetical protein